MSEKETIHRQSLFEKRGFWYFALSLIILLLYYKVYQYDYIDYDDPAFVFGNPLVKSGLSFRTLLWALTTFDIGHWHPLVWISYLAEVSIFGPTPGLMHLTNVFLHLLNTLILFRFLSKITRATTLSGVVSILFAIHPMHVEAVVWLSARKDVLCTLFTFLALYFYSGYAQTKNRRYYYLSMVVYVLGMMSKSMIITLPALMLLLDFWPLKRIDVSAQKSWCSKDFWNTALKLLKEKLAYFIITVVFCVIAFIPQDFEGAVMSVHSMDIGTKIDLITKAYIAYLKKTFWPYTLYLPYLRSVGPSTGFSFLSSSILLTITVWAIYHIRKYPFLIFGWLWFFVVLLPVSGIVPFGAHFMADRYTYVPHVGLFIMVVWYVHQIWPSGTIQRLLKITLGIFILILLIWTSGIQIAHWENDRTLFGHTLIKDPDNFLAHSIMGSHYEIKLKDDQKAVEHYMASVAANQNYAPAQNNLGELYWKKQAFGKAEKHFLIALKLNEKKAGTHLNLANIYIVKKDVPRAMRHIDRALVLDPYSAPAYHTLGVMLAAKGDLHKAEEYFVKALKLDPELDIAQKNLNKLRVRMKKE